MKQILNGILIGIGKIIPGVSGSLIAISLGVYEESISCITNFFSNLKYNAKYLGLLGLGIIISIISLSRFIVFLLENYYVVTMSLFVGLILGSNIENNFKDKRYNYISLITFSIVLSFGLVSGINEITFSNSFVRFFYIFFIGLVEAATMIIPGISGTAVLMILGAYDLLIKTYSNILNISLLLPNLSVLMPLMIGIISGTYLVSKMINYCFKRYYLQTNKAIKGFLYGTVIYMVIEILKNFNSLSELLMGMLVLFVSKIIITKIKVNHFR